MALRLATYQDAGYEPANGLRTATLDDLDEKSPAVTDYFKAVASGVGSGVVQPLGWLARKIGAENIGGGAERVGDQTSEYWRRSMSNEGQRALRHKIVDYDEQGNIRFDPKFSTIALSAAESLPSMLATAIPGAAVTKVGTAMKVAPALAGAVGFGAMEGVQAGAQNASDTGMSVRKMTPADLSKSPVYQELRTSGLTHEQAREETARRAENEVFTRTAPSTALLGAVPGAVYGRIMGKTGQEAVGKLAQKIGQRGSSALEGLTAESAQEFLQSGSEQAIQNLAEQKYVDPTKQWDEDVLNQSVTGGLAGGLLGGGTGAVLHGGARPKETRNVGGDMTSPQNAPVAGYLPEKSAVSAVSNAMVPYRSGVTALTKIGLARKVAEESGAGVINPVDEGATLDAKAERIFNELVSRGYDEEDSIRYAWRMTRGGPLAVGALSQYPDRDVKLLPEPNTETSGATGKELDKAEETLPVQPESGESQQGAGRYTKDYLKRFEDRAFHSLRAAQEFIKEKVITEGFRNEDLKINPLHKGKEGQFRVYVTQTGLDKAKDVVSLEVKPESAVSREGRKQVDEGEKPVVEEATPFAGANDQTATLEPVNKSGVAQEPSPITSKPEPQADTGEESTAVKVENKILDTAITDVHPKDDSLKPGTGVEREDSSSMRRADGAGIISGSIPETKPTPTIRYVDATESPSATKPSTAQTDPELEKLYKKRAETQDAIRQSGIRIEYVRPGKQSTGATSESSVSASPNQPASGYGIEEISDKAFVLKGDKDSIKSLGLGGIWNDKRGGMVFPNRRLDAVKAKIESPNISDSTGNQTPQNVNPSSSVTPEIKPLPKGLAVMQANRKIKSGAPSKVIEHPKENGKYAVVPIDYSGTKADIITREASEHDKQNGANPNQARPDGPVGYNPLAREQAANVQTAQETGETSGTGVPGPGSHETGDGRDSKKPVEGRPDPSQRHGGGDRSASILSGGQGLGDDNGEPHPSTGGRGHGRDRGRDSEFTDGDKRDQVRNSESGERTGRRDGQFPDRRPDRRNRQPESQAGGSDVVHETPAVHVAEPENRGRAGRGDDRGRVLNYRITESDRIGEGSQNQKFGNNISAIRLLKTLESENRNATPEEQSVLVKYAGWGGIPQAFDSNNKNWADEHHALKELLTNEEYSAARGSTLNAHYTSPKVIKAIYSALERLGFTGGRVIEPAMGAGHFMGFMPPTIKSNSRITGVEIDDLTGRIAQKLYPEADIRIQGFEKAKFPDNYFDLAISNVPFGDYKLHDPRYDKLKLRIHDYFFAKSLDIVRPGGLVMFVTSKGTLDKKDSYVRDYMAKRAELIGAIRLPNDAFKKNANTEVTTDIVILRKYADGEKPKSEPKWRGLSEVNGKDGDVFMVNEYFASHPEMMLGQMAYEGKMYRKNEATLVSDGRDIGEALEEAVNRLPDGIYEPSESAAPEVDSRQPETFDERIKNGAHVLRDGEIMVKDNGTLVETKYSGKVAERVKGMIGLRDVVKDVLRTQLDTVGEPEIESARKKLNRLYDQFIEQFGYINVQANRTAFGKDPDYPLLSSIERNYNKKKNTAYKADIFIKRVVSRHEPVAKVDTAQGALAVSLNENGKIALDHMSRIYGKPEKEIIAELKGAIYKDPESGEWVTEDDYLSGNVRHKLETAVKKAQDNPSFQENVEALKAVQPVDLKPGEIDVRLGSSWIPTDDVRDFVASLLEIAPHNIRVNHAANLGFWSVESDVRRIETNTQKWGTPRYEALQAVLDALNLKTPTIMDVAPDDNKKKVVNQKETEAAREKQQKIKDEFKNWIWREDERTDRLARKYNEEFNNTRLRAFSGAHLTLPGANPQILAKLKPHQRAGVWRIVQTGNTGLFHVVGAGKTYTMAGAGMELRRLGIARKPMYVVPNHMLEQFSREILELYPTANILVADKRDFEKQNRRLLMSRIATNDWDAVVVTHASFRRLPMSAETQSKYYKEQIEEVTRLIEEEKRESGRDSKIVKQIEAVRKKLEEKYAKRLNDIQKDQDKAVTFEETGVDWLFVDEAHEFKNLQFPTKMSRVAGLNNSQSVKSDDMFLKTIHVNRLQKGRGGVVFATGTPVSNTMAEMFTMQRYLQLDTLKRQGLLHFDSWAASFGEAVTSMELAPDGSGYRLNTRFSKFVNLPELMGMFRQVSDIQTAEMLNLPVPQVRNGKPQTVSASSSGILKQYVETLVRRSERIRSGQVDPREDNMLKVTNDGRKAALDMRLIDPSLPDEPNSKVNRAADNIYRVWEETKDSSYAESKTSGAAQLVFCDLSTPKKKSKKPKKTKKRKDGKEAEDSTDSGENGDSKKEVNMDEVLADSGAFSVYDDIREKLIQRGIPQEEIAFIHDYEGDQQKAELFNDVREGRVRILLGSTSKMGAGTNVQKRLVALHHLDAPWRPADIEQREGRIVRQGNENPEVQIYRYVTEGSFDAYMWQTLESKARFISQVMRGDNYLRNIDDVAGAALSYAEVKAIASGNPKVMEKAKVNAEARRLSTLKRAWQDEQRDLQVKSRRIPESIEWWGKYRDDVADDIKARKDVTGDNFTMAIQGNDYAERKEANDALRAIISKYGGLNTQGKRETIGNYAGFKLAIAGKGYGTELRDPEIYLRGKRDYYFTVPFNSENVNVTVRLENLVKNLESERARAELEIGKLERDLKTVKEEHGKPFEHELKLKETLSRQAELDKELEIGRNDEPMIAEEESDEDKPPEMSFDGLDKSIYQDSRFREIRKMAERLNKAFPNLPSPVTVIDSINDLPPNLRNRIQQAANKSVNGKPMMVSVSGLFDPKANRIYLVADGLIRKSTAKGQPLNRAVLEVLFHEATHGATDRLIDMFGGDWKGIVDNVFGHWSNNPVVRKEIAEIKQLYKEADWRTEKGRNTIARELIARMGESHTDHDFTRWIIAKLRQVLRRIAKALGVKMNISHADMVEAIRALKQSWENKDASPPTQPPVGNKKDVPSDSGDLDLSLTGRDDKTATSEPMTGNPEQEDFVKTTLAYGHAIYNSLFPIKKYQVSGYDPATGAERRDTYQSPESSEKAARALRNAGYADVNIQPVGAVGFLQKTLLSPEYWNHPVFKRFIDTALRRQDTRHEHLNKFLTDDDGEEIYRKLDRLKKPQYRQLENVLVWADTKDWNPPKDVTDKSAWKETKTIGEMERRGYSKEVIDAWKSVRRAYDRALDTWIGFQGKDPLSLKMLAQEINITDDAGKQHRLTLREALDEMGELRGSYAPRQRIGEYVVRAKDKTGALYRYHRNRVEGEKLHAELKAREWKVEPVQEAERMAESVYQELKIPMTQKAIEEAIRTAKLGENTKQVYESLIIEMANLIKARGFRSRAITRNVDTPVVHGYETDPKTALLQYASSLSSGLAKAEAAREMYSAINEIDSRKEAETYDLAVSYVANQLRNSDHIDGQLGFIKSLAAFKYLGFNVKSAAVNLLSLPTTAPAAIHEYAGGKNVGARTIARQLSQSVRDFGLWMAGKDVKLTENERKLLNELKQKAWANPQATTEALSHINSRTRTGQISNAWAKLIETAMAPFGFTERINRGSTILAAYRVAVQSGMTHDEAVKAAKLASDRAHGIYNKATLPIWAQGTMGRAFQPMLIFSKYGHNYMQLLYELGFRRKNYKAMIYASLAPIVLGGGMAIPMKHGILWAAGSMLSAIGIDDDPEKWWWDATRKYLGENGERVARYGAIGYFTPIQLSGSLQPNIGVGIPSNVWELMGAGGGVIKDFHEGFDALSKGDLLGAPKALLPSAFSAPFRAYSEYTHGLATKRHKAIFDERGRIVKPTLAEAVLKGSGFQPTRTSMILARRYEGSRESANYSDRRNSLYDEYRILASRGAPPSDMEKFLERVYRYNATARTAGEPLITPQALQWQTQTFYRAARKDWMNYQ